MSAAKETLHTDFVAGERRYWSGDDMIFSEHHGEPIVVEKNFLSDGASIPQAFHSFFVNAKAPFWLAAAMMHDWLYKQGTGNITRKMADKLFYYYLRKYRVGWWTAKLIYTAVRFGARKFFKVETPKFYDGNHQH